MEAEKSKKKKIMETRGWQSIIAYFGSMWTFVWFIAALVTTPWFIRWLIEITMGYEVSILKIYLFSLIPMVSIWSLTAEVFQDRLARLNYVGDPVENAIKILQEWKDEDNCEENHCGEEEMALNKCKEKS